MLNETKDFCSMGFKIFPINYKSKVPMKGYKWKEKATSDFNKIQEDIQDLNQFNLAMLTGKANNIFVLDIDKKNNGFETLKNLEEKLGKLPDTVTVNSGGGGIHLYFQYPNDVKITGVANLLGDGVDTRTDNNYIVIPPSIHESGKKYEWVSGKSIFEIKPKKLPQAWVDALVEASNRNQKSLANSSCSTTDNIISKKIPEGNRENSMFKFACSMRNKVANIDELNMIIKTLNTVYCTPPLSDKEVELAVKSAWNYKEKNDFKPQLYSLSDLKNIKFPEPNWIIPEFMPSGLHILAGKPKIGKSWLVLNIALTISNGGILLGTYQCNVKNVLYLALEDTGARIQKRLSKLTALGDNLEHITLCHNWITVKQGGLEALEKIITEKNLDLIFIDTLQCFRGPDMLKNNNAYFEDYYIMGELKNLADKYNIAIVLIHHLNKSKTGNTFDNVSGSNGLIGACDTIYTLTGTKDYNTLSFKGRDVYGDDILFEVKDGLCVPLDFLHGSSDLCMTQNQILALFQQHHSLSIKKIIELTELSESNIKYHLKKMVEKGVITKEERGIYTIITNSN